MSQLGRVVLAGIALAALVAAGAPAQAKSMKRQLIGTWQIVSAVVTQGDARREVFGQEPKGYLYLQRDGRFVQVLVAAGLPKFASRSRDTGTAEENKEVVTKSLAFFGTWTVDEARHTVSLAVEASTYPNYDGTTLERLVTTLTADRLVWTNPTPSQGSGSGEVSWKRAASR